MMTLGRVESSGFISFKIHFSSDFNTYIRTSIFTINTTIHSLKLNSKTYSYFIIRKETIRMYIVCVMYDIVEEKKERKGKNHVYESPYNSHTFAQLSFTKNSQIFSVLSFYS